MTKENAILIYRYGLIRAIEEFGVYKDGAKYIGCMERPLKEIKEEINRGRWDHFFDFDIDFRTIKED